MNEFDSSPAQPQSEFRKTWNTAHIKKQDRFDYFREGLCQAFLSLSPERPKDGEIEAFIETAELPRGFVSRVEATPHRICRTNADVGALPSEFLLLVLQSSGTLRSNVGGTQCTQRTGDLGLVEANKVSTFDIEPGTPYRATALIFDKSLLTSGPRHDLASLGDRYRKAIRSCLNLIDHRYSIASASELSCLFDACISLLQSGSICQQEYLEDQCTKVSATRKGVLQLIQHFIRQNIADPDLSTSNVAAHFGISPRYLQKLFADNGTTFKTYVCRLRLEQIQADLLDRAIAHVPASDIAFRWGFRDMTTFHRNFRSRFGDTPGQVRIRDRG